MILNNSNLFEMDKKSIILDVRRPDEYAKGHAEGSVNISYRQLEAHLNEIRKWESPIVCVCGGGTRNVKAHDLLESHGIKSTAGGSWKKY